RQTNLVYNPLQQTLKAQGTFRTPAEVKLILGDERRRMLFSYIVENTQKSCSLLRRSITSGILHERDLKSRLLPAAVVLYEVVTSRGLKRVREEGKENMDESTDPPSKVKRNRMSADQRLALGLAR
ncbi:hypothetical protein K438DRAFT_1790976, partial [Mycena galopus ATCC 62051]